MISVCMATYNGERWIEEQLKSVLLQLNEDDEVVLIDDGSSDDTLKKVQEFEDSRIRIFHNETNLGVDKTFERALTLACGNILFLCDQDDIWYSGKVERIMEVFDKHPDVTLVLSDAQIIDAAGCATGISYFVNREKFIPGVLPNILKSKHLGCAIAIKSTMRNYFLPFPEKIPGHDVWIGIVNEYYGKTYFISEPLIGYRRHDKNSSSMHRKNLKQIITWRWELIKSLTTRVCQLSFK